MSFKYWFLNIQTIYIHISITSHLSITHSWNHPSLHASIFHLSLSVFPVFLILNHQSTYSFVMLNISWSTSPAFICSSSIHRSSSIHQLISGAIIYLSDMRWRCEKLNPKLDQVHVPAHQFVALTAAAPASIRQSSFSLSHQSFLGFPSNTSKEKGVSDLAPHQSASLSLLLCVKPSHESAQSASWWLVSLHNGLISNRGPSLDTRPNEEDELLLSSSSLPPSHSSSSLQCNNHRLLPYSSPAGN